MKKIIKNEDLRDVNGGYAGFDAGSTTCPNCGTVEEYYVEPEGSGCNQTSHYVCKKCGHRWS